MSGNAFTRLFGQSPIQPIQEHMRKAHACAEQLIPFIEATIDDDWDKADLIRAEIGRMEDRADELKKDMRLNLPKSLLMPINRSDLLDLITRQDKVANCAKDISGLMLGRHMQFPASIAPLVLEFMQTAVDTSAQAVKTIQEMDELVEMGFRGNVIELIEQRIEELDRLEHANDNLQVKVRAALFAIEKDLPPIDVMFLYKVIDYIGELADRAQKVGSRMHLLIAR